ncbi:MAG: hypothetical protein J6N49_03640 [Alphaproteobacteria bacterium]|nr:hypothetical protein [Alphaproteobacteria bacterium]
MSENDQSTVSNDDFEALLNNFINAELPVEENTGEPKEDPAKTAPNVAEPPANAQVLDLNAEDLQENEELSQAFEQELADAFSEARDAVDQNENAPELGSEESELAQAFINYKTSVDKLAKEHLNDRFYTEFSIDFLYPNYKPSVGELLSDDLVKGWLVLSQIFPQEVGSFPTSSTDEEFLNFAETLKNQDLQLAVISYVEILIDMESCELTYRAKLAQYQEKHIKRIMYEEYLARKERQRKFTEAVKKKNFPIDAERLITNYFRVAQKDVDGAFKALTTNPAIFAPIDFSKIKPRFFGLIKVTPKDGIRLNSEIGNFMKKLKV